MGGITLIIGITGYYCSGKSSIERILCNKYNFKTIDVDKYGHLALDEKLNELVNVFGPDIITEGKVDRKKLGAIVFNDKHKLKFLNSIVHPVMVSAVKDRCRELNGNICINAALLFEMGLSELCSRIIVKKSNIFTLIKRGKKRDSFKFGRVLNILKNQKCMKYAKKQN